MDKQQPRPVRPISDVITGVKQPHKMALAPKKQRRSHRKAWIALISSLVIIGLAGGGLYLRARGDDNRVLSEQGVSFKYPKTYQVDPNPGNKNAIAVLRQTNPVGDITVAKEQGADTGALLIKRNVLDVLEQDAAKSLPLSYPSFQKDGDVRTQLDGFNAADFYWHYVGKDKKTIIYDHLFIIPRGHDAYYVTMESVSQKDVNNLAAQIKNTIRLP